MVRQHLVDFVLDVMKEIGSSKPFLFQRDGALFVASKAGFGYLTPGLQTWPEEIRDWEKREQPLEIRESVETMKRVKKGDNVVCQFAGKEKGYVAPISFGPDATVFTLKDISRAVEKLGKLKDDGKIRLVSHDSGYHSHKYGYACDGMDVWLTCARVMNRNTYLEIMRQNEDKLLASLETSNAGSREMNRPSYDRATIPRGIIFTRNLIASLPLREELVYNRESATSWSESTELLDRERNRNRELPSTYHESPYGIYVRLNSVENRAQTAAEYKKMRMQTINGADRELQVLGAHMNEAEAFIAEMNAIHNKIGAKHIAWSKDLRESTRAKR